MRSKSTSLPERDRRPAYESIVLSTAETFIWRCDDYPLPWAIWNSHPECEVHYIRCSEGICQIGDHIGSFMAGDLFLIGSNLPHNWVTPLEVGETIRQRDVVVQFDPERIVRAGADVPELQQLGALFDRARRGIVFRGQARARGAAFIEEIGNASRLGRLSRLIDLLDLLNQTEEYALLSSAGFVPSLDLADNRVLARVFNYLAENLEGDVRLSRVACIAGMTETSFSRFFKKRTGNTFSRHLSELRIGKACGLLASTDLAITEISHSAGYGNLSNFNRAFRELRSITPSRYRALSRV
jgi:AraC-like DNA-binding protein